MRFKPKVIIYCDDCDKRVEILLYDNGGIPFKFQIDQELGDLGWQVFDGSDMCPDCRYKEKEKQDEPNTGASAGASPETSSGPDANYDGDLHRFAR